MKNNIKRGNTINLSRLKSSLSFQLRLAQLIVYDRFFSELGDRDFNPGELSVLWAICNNPSIRQNVVAQNLMIKKAHMTKLVRLLENKGLVTRTIPDSDRRAVELTATPLGEESVKEVEDWFFSYDERIGSLTKEERRQLKNLLCKFIDPEHNMTCIPDI